MQQIAEYIGLGDFLQGTRVACPQIVGQPLPKRKRRSHLRCKQPKCMRKASAFQKAFKRFGNMRQARHFLIGDPIALQYRVRGLRQASVAVFLFFSAQLGSVQQLKKTKLQQVARPIRIVKGSREASITLGCSIDLIVSRTFLGINRENQHQGIDCIAWIGNINRVGIRPIHKLLRYGCNSLTVCV